MKAWRGFTDPKFEFYLEEKSIEAFQLKELSLDSFCYLSQVRFYYKRSTVNQITQ